MLLFFSIIILIMLFIILVLSSELKIKINKLKIHSVSDNFKPEYNIDIGLYFAKKIKWFNFKMENNEVPKLFKNKFIEEKLKNLKLFNKGHNKIQRKIIKIVVEQIRKNIVINTLKLKVYIDTKDVLATSYLVGIISASIPNIVRPNLESFDKKCFEYSVIPLFKNQNYLYLSLNSIISIKVVHIINMLKMTGGINNERTSNRRFNVNCYGKY